MMLGFFSLGHVRGTSVQAFLVSWSGREIDWQVRLRVLFLKLEGSLNELNGILPIFMFQRPQARLLLGPFATINTPSPIERSRRAISPSPSFVSLSPISFPPGWLSIREANQAPKGYPVLVCLALDFPTDCHSNCQEDEVSFLCRDR